MPTPQKPGFVAGPVAPAAAVLPPPPDGVPAVPVAPVLPELEGAEHLREFQADLVPDETPQPFEGFDAGLSGNFSSMFDEGRAYGMDEGVHRGQAQNNWWKAGAVVARLPNIIPETIEEVGYALDFENYAGALGQAETDFDNGVSKLMREGKDVLEEAAPIYAENAGSWADSATWFDQGSNLINSIGSFFATGAGIGAVAGRGARALGMAAKARYLAGAIQEGKTAMQLTDALATGVKLAEAPVTAAQFGTSALLAFTGGVMQAQDSYKNIYALAKSKGKSDEEAKTIASDAAASIVRWTTATTSLLNVTSLGPIFRPFKAAAQAGEEALTVEALAGKAGKKVEELTAGDLLSQLKALKADPTQAAKVKGFWQQAFEPEWLAWEMGQESGEEYFEQLDQLQGEDRARRTLGLKEEFDWTSKEALIAAALGAVGGGLGKGVMTGIEKLNSTGTDRQDTFTQSLDVKIKALESFQKSQEALKQASAQGASLDALILKNEVFSQQVFHAIQTGTVDYLKQLYQDVLNLTPDQADAQGYVTDPKNKEHYKDLAKGALLNIDRAEHLYNTVQADQSIPQDVKGQLISSIYSLSAIDNQRKTLRQKIQEVRTEDGDTDPVRYAALKLRALDMVEQFAPTTAQGTAGDTLARTRQIRQQNYDQLLAGLDDVTRTEVAKNGPGWSASSAEVLNLLAERTVLSAQRRQVAPMVEAYYDPKKKVAAMQQVRDEQQYQQKRQALEGVATGLLDAIQKADATSDIAKLADALLELTKEHDSLRQEDQFKELAGKIALAEAHLHGLRQQIQQQNVGQAAAAAAAAQADLDSQEAAAQAAAAGTTTGTNEADGDSLMDLSATAPAAPGITDAALGATAASLDPVPDSTGNPADGDSLVEPTVVTTTPAVTPPAAAPTAVTTTPYDDALAGSTLPAIVSSVTNALQIGRNYFRDAPDGSVVEARLTPEVVAEKLDVLTAQAATGSLSAGEYANSIFAQYASAETLAASQQLLAADPVRFVAQLREAFAPLLAAVAEKKAAAAAALAVTPVVQPVVAAAPVVTSEPEVVTPPVPENNIATGVELTVPFVGKVYVARDATNAIVEVVSEKHGTLGEGSKHWNRVLAAIAKYDAAQTPTAPVAEPVAEPEPAAEAPAPAPTPPVPVWSGVPGTVQLANTMVGGQGLTLTTAIDNKFGTARTLVTLSPDEQLARLQLNPDRAWADGTLVAGDRIRLDLLANPLFGAGQEVTFEVDENEWWKNSKNGRKSHTDASTHYREIPIFVLWNGQRVGKLPGVSSSPALDGLRSQVYSALASGRQVRARVADKLAGAGSIWNPTGGPNGNGPGNLINLRQDGKPLLRSASVLGPRWVDGQWNETTEVQLTLAKGVSASGGFVPENASRSFAVSDRLNLPDDQLGRVRSLTRDSEKADEQDGHVFALVQDEVGDYFPFKLFTSFLTPDAADKVLTLLREKVSGDPRNLVAAEQIVHLKTPFDQAEAEFRKGLQYFEGANGDFMRVWDDSSGQHQFLNFDVADWHKAVRDEAVTIPVRVQVGQTLTQNLPKSVSYRTVETRELPLDAFEEMLRSKLLQKRFNIQEEKLNSSDAHRSLLTGKTYRSYNAYLTSTEEAPGAILQTDALNTYGINHRDLRVNLTGFEVNSEEAGTDVQQQVSSVLGGPSPVSTIVEPAANVTPRRSVRGRAGEVYRLGPNDGYPDTAQDVQEQLDWLQARDMDASVMEYVRYVGGRYVHGVARGAVVQLARHNDPGTHFHEGFHVMLRVWTDPKNRARILQDAREQLGYTGSDLDVEEQLAEDFRRYAQRREAHGGRKADSHLPFSVRRFFKKLWDWVTYYVANRQTIDRMFDQLYSNDLSTPRRRFDARKQTPLATHLQQEAFSAKAGFTATTQRELTNAIATFIISRMDPVLSSDSLPAGSILEEARQELLRRAFLDKQSGQPVSRARGLELYETYGKALLADLDRDARGEEVLDDWIEPEDADWTWSEARDGRLREMLLRVVERWEDAYSDDKYRNLLERGWRSLTVDKLADYGLGVKGELTNLDEQLDTLVSEEKIYGMATIEQSTKDALTGPVRRFLQQIPLVDNNNNPVLGLLGTAQLVPFGTEVYPILLRGLQGAATMADMLQKLKELGLRYPWVATVVDKLENGTSDEFRAQFWQALCKVEHKQYYIDRRENLVGETRAWDVKLVDANQANPTINVLEAWKGRASTSEEMGGTGLLVNGVVSRAKLNRFKELRSILQIGTDVVTSENGVFVPTEAGMPLLAAGESMLSLLGARLPSGTLLRYLNDGDYIGPNRPQKADILFWYLFRDNNNDRAGNTGLEQMEKTLQQGNSPYISDRSALRRFARIEERYGSRVSLAYSGIDGKIKFPYNQPTALSDLLAAIRNDEPFLQRLTGDALFCPEQRNGEPYIGSFYSSPLLKYIFSFSRYMNGRRLPLEFLELASDGGEKKRSRGETKTSGFDELSEKTNLRTRLDFFLNSGSAKWMKIALTTSSDRAKIDFITLPRVVASGFWAGGNKLGGDWIQGADVPDVFRGYVVQDILRAVRETQYLAAGKPPLKNYHYGKKAGDGKGRAFQFTQLPFLESVPAAVELRRIALADHGTEEAGQMLVSLEAKTELWQQIDDAVRQQLTTYTTQLVEAIKELDLQKDLDTKFYGSARLDQLAYDFVVANIIGKNELAKLTAGDYAFYKGYGDYVKRYGGLSTPGPTGYQAEWNNASGFRSYGMPTTFQQAFINDFRTQAGTYASGIGTLSAYMSQDALRPYREGSNKSDATSVVTLDFYRQQAQGEGSWTMPTAEYPLGKPGGKSHEQAWENYHGTAKAQSGSTPGVFATVLSDDSLYYPKLVPIKTNYYGPTFTDGRMVPIYIKHAAFPLLQEMTRSYPVLDALRTRMEDSHNPIHQVSMDSTAKAGLWGNFSVETDEAGAPTNLDNLLSIKLESKWLRTPQRVPDSQSRDPLAGSQYVKHITSGLFDNKNYVLSDGTTLTGSQLKAQHHAAAVALMQLSQDTLLSGLGLDLAMLTDRDHPLNGDTAERLNMMKRLVSKIRQEASDGGEPLTDNELRALQLTDKSGRVDTTLPLDSPVFGQKFERMILGWMKKEVAQQRRNGQSLVQIAELGGYSGTAGVEKVEKSSELKFVSIQEGDTTITHAECAIPWAYAEKLGLKPEADGSYDLSKVDPRVLTLISYRIPTGGKNTMCPMKVVRVLPKNMKAILVPGDITTQMGSDFDVDKLFLIQPPVELAYAVPGVGNVTRAQFITDSLNNLLEDAGQLEELSEDEIDALFNKELSAGELLARHPEWDLTLEQFEEGMKEAGKSFKDQTAGLTPVLQRVSYDADVQENLTKPRARQRLESMLFDQEEAILRSPLHASEVYSSIDSNALVAIAKELAAKNPVVVDPLDPLVEVKMSERNKSGQAGIGIFATSGTGYAVGQEFTDGTRRLAAAPEVAVRLNGKVYTDLTLVDPRIAKSYDEALQVSVDNGKDGWMPHLNLNPFTAPVFRWVQRLVPTDDAQKFAALLCTQPIVQQITRLYLNGGYTPDRLGELITETFAKGLPKGQENPFDARVIESLNFDIGKLEDGSASPLAVAQTFYAYHLAGRALGKVNKVANADRLSDATSFAGLEGFADLMDEIIDPDRQKYVLNADLALAGLHPLMGKYIETWDTARSLGEALLPTDGHRAFARLAEDLRTLLGKKTLTDNNRRLLRQEAKLYLLATSAQSPLRGMFSKSGIQNLFQSTDAVVARLEKMQNTYPRNELLHRLSPSANNGELAFDGTSFVTMSFAGGFDLESEDYDVITGAWEELFQSKDKETRRFAKDLVFWTLLSHGFTASTDSLVKFIPIAFIEDARYYNPSTYRESTEQKPVPDLPNQPTLGDFFRQLPGLVSQLAGNSQPFFHQLAQNNAHLDDLLPREYKLSFEESQNGRFTRPDRGRAYVRTFDGNQKKTVLYRGRPSFLDGMTNFDQIPVLGIPYKLKQYGNAATDTRVVAATPEAAVVVSVPASELPAATAIKFQESTGDYRERTIENVRQSDVTLVAAIDPDSAGEKLTRRAVQEAGKPMVQVDLNFGKTRRAELIAEELAQHLNAVPRPYAVLNVAGNGIYTFEKNRAAAGRNQQGLNDWMELLLKKVQTKLDPEKTLLVRSGGQTGVDEAGIVAANKLGLRTLVLAPKGWKFRGLDGKDISSEQQFKDRFKPAQPLTPQQQVVAQQVLDSGEHQPQNPGCST